MRAALKAFMWLTWAAVSVMITAASVDDLFEITPAEYGKVQSMLEADRSVMQPSVHRAMANGRISRYEFWGIKSRFETKLLDDAKFALQNSSK